MKTSYQGNMEKTARAVGTNLPISTKVSYEIANAIRGKDAKKTVSYLENVVALKQAVPYKRYNMDVGHKPGKMAAGRYPVKAASNFIKVLKNAIANAVNKLDYSIKVSSSNTRHSLSRTSNINHKM